jgi:hypothetical protein
MNGRKKITARQVNKWNEARLMKKHPVTVKLDGYAAAVCFLSDNPSLNLRAKSAPRYLKHLRNQASVFRQRSVNTRMATERTKKILLGGAVLLVVLSVLAIVLGRPAYHRYKEKRAVQQARAFYQKQDYRNALFSLRQALAMNSSNVEAVVLMGNVLADLRAPAAFAWRQRAVQLAPTLDNKILLISVALQVERPPFPISTQMLEEIRYAAPTNIAYHMLSSQLAIRRNQLPQAEAEMQTVANLDPTNRLHQLNLAVLHLQSTNSEQTAGARSLLISLTNDPVLGEHALRSLIADGQLAKRYDEAQKLSAQLLSLPQATFGDRLQQLTLLANLKSPELPRQLGEIKIEASTNVAYAAQTAQWLLAHQEPKQAREWLFSLPPTVSSTPPLPLMITASYADAKEWPAMEGWLTKQRWDQEYLRFAWLSLSSEQQKRGEMSDIYWQRAISAAEKRTEFLTALTQLSASWNWTNKVEDLLHTIGKRDATQAWAWQILLERRMAAGDTTGLYQLYSEMLAQNPKSLIAKNNVAVIDLLLNRNLSNATQFAKEVYLSATNHPLFVSTYAFALHVQNQSGEGLKLMKTLPPNYLHSPEIAIYYAVLLSANGERVAAEPYFDAAKKSQMLPEEKQLLEKYSAH